MERRAVGALVFAVVAGLLSGDVSVSPTTAHTITMRRELAPAARAASVRFEANAGQWDARVRFVAHDHQGGTVFITDDGAAIELRDATRAAAVALRLVGMKPSAPHGEDELVTKSNFFLGNDPTKWRTDVANFGRVRARDALPGVDVVWHEGGTGLEYDFEVAVGVDAESLAIEIEGATSLATRDDGSLEIATAVGAVVQNVPRVVQDGRELRTRYRIEGSHRIGFDIDGYDHGRPILIDPTLIYSTYLGGSGSEGSAYDVAVDSSGNAYVTGSTPSTNFPTTTGVYQTSLGGSQDVVVTKVSAVGSTLVYSTYLGGSGYDYGYSIALDSSGNAYVTGYTSGSFPTTTGAYQTTYGGGSYDAFVAKLNASGSSLTYSTYLGGSGYDQGVRIAIDASGDAVVTGETSGSFPTTSGAYQTTYGGGSYDAFAAKLNSTGTALTYATYLGGSGLEIGRGVAIDSSGNAYVTGVTTGGFPTTSGAYQTTYGGGTDDVFVTKLNASGTALAYSTYLGGSSIEQGFSVAVDSSGYAYVTGDTNGTFPTTTGAYQTTLGGGFDVFITKLDTSGASLKYSTYVGGTGNDQPGGIALDSSGNVYISGNTDGSFPTTSGAYQTTFGGSVDAFVSELDSSGASLTYASYLGGSKQDYGSGIGIDSSGAAYITGYTGGSFPTTTGAFQTAYGGGTNDLFVAKFGDNALALNPTSGSTSPKGSISFSASGGSGGGYTFSLKTNASGGTINSSTGAYVAGTTGSVVDVVEVTDSATNTATANVAVGAGITISPTSPATPPKGAINFTASGGSGTGYTWALTANASGGSINTTSGAYVAGASGSVSDVVTVTDSLGNTATVTVNVGAVLAISPPTPSAPPNGAIGFSATGGSGTGFTWSIATNKSGATINASTGAYVAGATGSVADTVSVIDSLGNSASVNVSVGGGLAINPAAPSSPPRGTLAFTATGGSGAGVVWTLSTNKSGGSIGSSSGAYTAGATPNVTDVVSATDSLGNTSSVDVTVTAGVTIAPSTITLAPGSSTTFSAAGGSGKGYAWSVATNDSGGAITSAGVYTAGATGGVTDDVQLADSLGNTAHAMVTVSSVTVDAGPTEDAGTGTPSSGSCGCEEAGTPTSRWSLTAVVLFGLLAFRRRVLRPARVRAVVAPY